MMSKNSFLVDIKENNKRRIWLWILSSLLWFFYYPIAMLMIISRQTNNSRVRGYSPEVAKANLQEAVLGWIAGNNGILFLVVSLLAIVCAVQGFSYLYYRKKVDFYHSVPVKQSRRFAVIYLNGVFIFLLPYALNLLFAMAVAGVNGVMGRNYVAAAMEGMLFAVFLFLGTYSMAVLAVMLTGNLVISAFAILVFLVYELVVRGILQMYGAKFYDYFSMESIAEQPVLSPHWQMLVVYDKMDEAASWAAVCPRLLAVAAMAAAFTGIAWICYKNRPAEAAGRAMAFARMEGVIKVLLVIPFALAVGWFVMDVIGDIPYGMMVLGMALAVVIGSCVIEVIYEMDIKAIFHKKYQILLSGAGVAVIFLIYCFDLTGFDKWVPDPDKLEDTVVIFMEDMYGRNYMDAEMYVIDSRSYFLSRPGIRDHEAVCSLSEKKSADGRIWCTMIYRMKSGKEVWRSFSVEAEEEELLNRIMESQEYREAKCQLYDEEFYESIKKQKLDEFRFHNGFLELELELEDLDEFRDAYLKDLEKSNFSVLKSELICGQVRFEVKKESESGTWSRMFRYDVYPSYANTVTFLRERGINADSYLDVRKVESISVTNFHNEMYEERIREGTEAVEVEMAQGRGEYSVTRTFSDESRMEELVQALYPAYAFDTYWMEPGTVSNNYSVSIQYKDGTQDTAAVCADHRLITDRIPEWLERETAYE